MTIATADTSRPVTGARKRAWYHSIGGKLLIAFTLIAALTVGATWLSVIRFGEIESVMQRLTGVSLPAVKLSFGVEATTTEVAAIANTVGQADTETERFHRMDTLSERIGQLWSVLGQLKETAPETPTMKRLEELTASIDSLAGEINRTTRDLVLVRDRRRQAIERIPATSERAFTALRAVAGPADQAMNAALADDASTEINRDGIQSRLALLRAVSALRADLGAAAALLYQIGGADDAALLVSLRAQFDDLQAPMVRNIVALERSGGFSAEQILALRNSVRAVILAGVGANGLIDLQDQFLTHTKAAAAQQKSLEDIGGQLRTQVAALVTDAERDALATTALSANAIASSRIWLMLLAGASLVLAGLIVWLFVVRYVVARLTNLARSMLAIARGDLDAPIQAAGPDEIGDMSRALVVFRNNAREIRIAHEEADKARLEAEAASRTKSAFLANMSHELRTPLNAIIGYSEILVEDATDRNDTASVDDLQKIQGAGKHLLGLINGILDLSKIEAGRMDVYLEQIYLTRLVDEVRVIVEPLMTKNGNTLVIDCPPDVGSMRTDLTKLKQSLINLLSNAAKFTKDGKVTLALSRAPAADGASDVIFRVSDTGIGMTEEQLGRLFQAFTQADSSTTRNYGGTGLGLTISKHFAIMLDGSLDVTSKAGEGSTFALTLRDQVVTATPAAIDLPGATVVSGSGALTVLVVDDDPTVHDVLTATLTKEGYQLLHAGDGVEAMDIMRRTPPDIVTLDVMMPKVDGWSVLGMMKSDPELEHIPVIMVTIVDDRNLGYSLGASEFMTKPIDRNRLVSLVHRFTGQQTSGPVLVVDDDAQVREIARAAVQSAGLKTAEAASGRAALDWLNRNAPPALILLDLMMPEMDGFEFLDLVRDDDELRDVPIVVLTAKELTESERTFLAERTMLVLSKGAQPISTLGAALGAIAIKSASARSAAARAAT